MIFADIDLAKVAEARGRVPSLEHDKPFGVVPIADADVGAQDRIKQAS